MNEFIENALRIIIIFSAMRTIFLLQSGLSKKFGDEK